MQRQRVGRPGEREVDHPVHDEERVAAEPVAHGADDAAGLRADGVDLGRQEKPAPQERDRLVVHRSTTGEVRPRGSGRPGRRDEAPEAVQHAVGDRQHLVAVGLGGPQLGQLAQPLRLLVRAVDGFGEVLVTGRRAPSGPRRNRDSRWPAPPRRARPELMWLVVAFQPSWKIEREPSISKYWVRWTSPVSRILEDPAEAGPVDGLLGDAVDLVGRARCPRRTGWWA